ncbi:MAG: hypothetical protein U1E39_11240 [Planctomycetota bacterium]
MTLASPAAPLLLAVERVVGPVRFPAAPPAWAVVLLLAALALGVRWIYRRERQKVSRGWRIVLGGLRILAVAIVAGALFQPQREVAEVAEDRSHLVLLLDTSSSMRTVDRYRPDDEARILAAAYPEGGSDGRPPRLALSRGEILQRIVAGTGEPVLRALAERFVLHVYAFDEDLRLVGSTERSDDDDAAGRAGRAEEGAGPRPHDPATLGQAVRDLTFDGPSTSLGSALRGLAREFVGRDDRRLAGVVVVTDGRDNAEGERPLDAVAALGKGAEDLRVSAVAMGDPRLAKNLRVDKVLAKDEVLVQDEVTFLAQLRQTGFDGVEGVTVDLVITQTKGPDHRDLPRPIDKTPKGEAARRLESKVRLLPSAQATAATLAARFDEAGDYEVRVRATLPKSPHDYAAEDAVVEDDSKVHHLRVLDRTIKVLVVDREMRYETHFLKNVLVREARTREDPRRIDAHVWVQEYDTEVPQPASRSLTPLKAFPSTRQELFGYDVLVFGDVNWRKLGPTEERSREVLRILKDFVAEGGGIAFVAGETANPTAYLDTPLQDLLPVVVRASDRSDDLKPKTTPFRIAPTEVGREHPILSVLQTDPERVDRTWRERDGWEWYWLYRAHGGLKPGAFALARVWNAPGPDFVDDRGEPYVVFSGMGYGKGRVFFSAIDQISRIRMAVGDTFYGPFWDETIRWLATYRLRGGNARYKIETDKESYFVGETAVVKVWAFDRDFRPVRTDTLKGLQVEGPDGKPMLTDADAPRKDPDGTEGLYRTTLRLPAGGTYLAYVDPGERDGDARAEQRFVARFATKEAQDKVPDHDLLATLARATNPPGPAERVLVWSPWQLRTLLDGLESRTTPRQLSRRDEPLWDNVWPLVLATAILALEWILRKRFQMI